MTESNSHFSDVKSKTFNSEIGGKIRKSVGTSFVDSECEWMILTEYWYFKKYKI